MSHYKPYPAYKDSGVEWLGKVPEHWEISQMKSGIKSLQNGVWGEEPTGGPDDVACARVADFDRTGLVVEEPLPTLRRIPKEQRAYKNVRPGDLLLEKSGGGDQTTVGAMVQYLGISEIVCSNFVAAVKCKEGVSARWLCYANAHLYYLGVNTRSIKQATGIQNLDSNQYSAEPIAFPAYVEQQTIAAHLDRETTRIDTLIAKKTRFIKLLKEKRQTLITQAVTKGLNPNVKMKDSGVEWLGEVPEHWEVRPVKYLVEPKSGAIKTGPFGSQLTSAEMNSGTIRVYNQRNVIDGNLFSGENYISDDKFRQLSSFEVFPEDVLITTRGTIGRVIVAPKNLEKGILHPCLMRVQINKNLLILDFFSMLLGESHLLQSQIAHMSNASTIEVIYSETMGGLLLPVPPINEQKNIIFQVKKSSEKFYKLISKTQLSITLLKERRSALITAAVTGQIDLREAA